MKRKRIVSSVQFYDLIAYEYNNRLSGEEDLIVRQHVARFFTDNIPPGKILDFGGGTGLDLNWQLEAGYSTYFYEPSENMRSLAKKLSEIYKPDKQPFFLEHPDFRLWQEDNLPFEGKVDAVLANFGVLNYIDDLALFFEKLSLILKVEGSVVINLLYASPIKRITKYFPGTVKAVLKNDKLKTGSQSNGVIHEAILHSLSDITKASRKYFSIKGHMPLGKKSDFMLVHLIKK